jgi:hypothetical protein
LRVFGDTLEIIAEMPAHAAVALAGKAGMIIAKSLRG